MMKKRQVVVKRSEVGRISTTSSIRYGECQKNHAANIGGYAVDGCREFMASGHDDDDGGAAAAALMCAACGCHRNFHRREVESSEVVCEYSPPNN
ncbi:unnamed protein product [Linum trigynum]|uniref:ZF-HD dimerization-type domain-containing protein n=1 Tax=Linum trigynum TaxID=586398 RepID=A0AAV2G6I5_9ROSI